MQVPVCVCQLLPKDSYIKSPPSLRVSLVSRKGCVPSFSSAMVNLNMGCTSLRWWSKAPLHLSALCGMCHPHSYHFQNIGLIVQVGLCSREQLSDIKGDENLLLLYTFIDLTHKRSLTVAFYFCKEHLIQGCR